MGAHRSVAASSSFGSRIAAGRWTWSDPRPEVQHTGLTVPGARNPVRPLRWRWIRRIDATGDIGAEQCHQLWMALTNPEWSEIPRLVPARMVNEFAYCKRLFHLEWVQQLWADNEFTVDGRWQHRAVDEESGSVPDAGDPDAEIKRATSVSLSSDRLGLVAKADIIEGRDGLVVPVEVKRGRARSADEPVALPERVQLCVIALLLRDGGYRCDEGVVYFAESRQRVNVPLDDELVSTTLKLIEDLRKVAASREVPEPTEDVRKCNGCSLAGVCLPDEVTFLHRKRVEPPRRLVPSDDAARPMYVTEPGTFVRKSGGRLEVTKNREPIISTRLIDVSQLCLYGNVQVSTQLVRELMSRETPVMWFSAGGWFQGITEGLPGKNVDLRRRQYSVAEGGAIGIARSMIEGKIRNSRTILRRNTRERDKDVLDSLRRLANKAAVAVDVSQLLGFEGTAARLYFGQFSTMLRGPETLPGGTFSMAGRNRRPPTDPINCLLSYCYSLLVKDCVAVLRSVGFDPYLGFLHRPRFGRPALALDLAEELRPVVAESVVLTVVNNGEVRPAQFTVKAGGVSLTAEGRRAVLGAYERRMDTEITHPIFEYKATWRRILEVQARLLAAHLMGEVDGYPPMVVR